MKCFICRANATHHYVCINAIKNIKVGDINKAYGRCDNHLNRFYNEEIWKLEPISDKGTINI